MNFSARKKAHFAARRLQGSQRDKAYRFSVMRYLHIYRMKFGTLPSLSNREQMINDAFVERFASGRLYHGGAPGRRVGEYLLPQRQTKNDWRGFGEAVPYGSDLVYLTPSLDHAWRYARPELGGQAYLVDPDSMVSLGPVELRQTFLWAEHLGLSSPSEIAGHRAFRRVALEYCCERALVLEVIHG